MILCVALILWFLKLLNFYIINEVLGPKILMIQKLVIIFFLHFQII